MIQIGFTGTRKGMTEAQQERVFTVLSAESERDPTVVIHHGDCVGSDAQAHEIARRVGLAVIIHPPVRDEYRAHCRGATMVHRPLSYFRRDRAIIDASEYLIATPQSYASRAGGTWYTIGYARGLHKRVHIVWPNGDSEIWHNGN